MLKDQFKLKVGKAKWLELEVKEWHDEEREYYVRGDKGRGRKLCGREGEMKKVACW